VHYTETILKKKPYSIAFFTLWFTQTKVKKAYNIFAQRLAKTQYMPNKFSKQPTKKPHTITAMMYTAFHFKPDQTSL
jgi:hypothetical protein